MKTLIQASCIDLHYLRDCSKQQYQYYQTLGAMLVSIALIGGLAVAFTLHYVTSNYAICLFIGLVFGFVVLNLYRFMFTAIAGNSAYFEENQTLKLQFTAGDLARLLFIGLIGLIIAECLGLWVFKSSLNPIFKILDGSPTAAAYKALQKRLMLSTVDMQHLKANTLLNRFNVLHLAFGKKMWLVRGLVVLVVEIPLLLKSFLQSIRNGEYERTKYRHETLAVRHAYFLTEQQYKRIFKEKIGRELEIWSNYEDPPFNTQPIEREYNQVFT